MIIYNRIKDIPILVRTLSFLTDGWIVGGAAKYLAGLTDDLPRDWDIVISPEKWSEVCHIVPPGTVTNTWGGFKVDNIDFWCEDLGHYFQSAHHSFNPIVAAHLKSQRYMVCEL